jgi:hypothetical protein
LGTKWSSATAARTRSRSASATGLGLLLMMRDAVAVDTPARRATSASVATGNILTKECFRQALA